MTNIHVQKSVDMCNPAVWDRGEYLELPEEHSSQKLQPSIHFRAVEEDVEYCALALACVTTFQYELRKVQKAPHLV